MDNWQKDLSWSASIFIEQVVPILEDNYYPSQIIQLETISKNFAQNLDEFAGIDALQIQFGNIRGIASRIQRRTPGSPRPYPYNTFTVRMARDSGVRTEYAKRVFALSTQGWLYPYLTLQAYTDDNNKLLSMAVARTSRIMKAAETAPQNRTHNAIFCYIDWSEELCDLIYQNDRISHRVMEITDIEARNVLLMKLPLEAQESAYILYNRLTKIYKMTPREAYEKVRDESKRLATTSSLP